MYQSPEVIMSCADLLRQRMSLDPEYLETHVIELDAIRYDLAKATSETMEFLYLKRNQMLEPKDKNSTELDRLTRLNADVALIEKDYAFLQKLETLVEQRLALATVLIRSRHYQEN